jgi:hypothetical protein
MTKDNSRARNDRNNDDRNHDDRNHDSQDQDLRARFAELRREEESQAPQFVFPSQGSTGQVRRWSTGKLIAGAVCVVTLVAAAWLLRPAPHRPDRTGQPVASLMEWRSPTDFLLETPGRELLRSVPSIGVWGNHTSASRPRQRHPQVRKQVSP